MSIVMSAIGQRRRYRKHLPEDRPTSATRLLGTPLVDAAFLPAVDLPHELLADLYDPRPIIITPTYIGVERRRSRRQPPQVPNAHGGGLRLGQIFVAACIAAITATVLTLMVTHVLPRTSGVAKPASATLLRQSPAQRHVTVVERQASAAQRQDAVLARAAARQSRLQWKRTEAVIRSDQRLAQKQQRQAARSTQRRTQVHQRQAASAPADRSLARIHRQATATAKMG